MTEALIGALVGGILSWIGSYFSLRNEFKNQIELSKREDIDEEKSSFLAIKDEMEENKMSIKGYIKLMDANDKQRIDFEDDCIYKVTNQAWKQVRKRIFLSKNEKLVKDISNFYKGVHGMQIADMMLREDVYNIFNECINLIDEITEHIHKLEMELTYY